MDATNFVTHILTQRNKTYFLIEIVIRISFFFRIFLKYLLTRVENGSIMVGTIIFLI